MVWDINFCLIFLFCYTNGQIKQVPIDQQQKEIEPNKLKGIVPEIGGAFPLKGRKVQTVATSQWEKDGEAAYRWSNGRIRYYIDPSSYDNNVVSYLEAAFSQLSNFNECPDFVQLQNKPEDGRSWLHFTNPNRVRDCVHDLGQDENGEIVVVLGYDCLRPAQILHTILHGLGFRDEVTHPQRDLFVRVQWENIQPAFRSMFRIHSVNTGALLDYDPKSIMHFHDRAYTLNGQATIASLLPGLSIEPSGELSHLDKMKIRLAFGHECKKRQIDKILSSCGANKDEGDDSKEYETIIVPGKDVPNINTGGEQSDGGNAGQIVVPGTDVNPGGEQSDGGNAGQIVVPGTDVSLGGEQSDGANGGQIVVPGTDINPDGEQSDGGNTGQIVVPGTDVNPGGGQFDDGNAGQLVVPGDDVNLESDGHINPDGGQSDGGNAGDIVVPGNDVRLDDAETIPGDDAATENMQSGSDDLVIPGTNVQLDDKVTDNELASGNDGEVDNTPAGGPKGGIGESGNGEIDDDERERGIVITGNNVDLNSGDETLKGKKRRRRGKIVF